jgi:hypothetical protein
MLRILLVPRIERQQPDTDRTTMLPNDRQAAARVSPALDSPGLQTQGGSSDLQADGLCSF